MKLKPYFLILLGLLVFNQVSAQQNMDRQLLQINRQIDSIVQVKTQQFKAELERINRQLENKTISREEADTRKKQLAQQFAEELDYAIYKLTGDLKRASKGRSVIDSVVNRETAYHIRRVRLYHKAYYDKDRHKNKHTFAYVFLSAGFNNVLDRNKVESLEFSPYGYIHSRYFELGMDWKTGFLHQKAFLVYGFSFVWHTLKPTGNRYHILVNDTVKIVEHPNDLERSKLRHIWLKIPLGLELNFPDAKRSHLHLSAGVFGKFRLTTKQKLTYFANGDSHDEVVKNDYTMPNFAYGLTGAVGGTDWSVYANYDLTPLFKNSRMHLISIGVKWRL